MYSRQKLKLYPVSNVSGCNNIAYEILRPVALQVRHAPQVRERFTADRRQNPAPIHAATSFGIVQTQTGIAATNCSTVGMFAAPFAYFCFSASAYSMQAVT